MIKFILIADDNREKHNVRLAETCLEVLDEEGFQVERSLEVHALRYLLAFLPYLRRRHPQVMSFLHDDESVVVEMIGFLKVLGLDDAESANVITIAIATIRAEMDERHDGLASDIVDALVNILHKREDNHATD